GKVKRVWDVSDGFPLRSEVNLFCYAGAVKPADKGHAYPSNTPFDAFIEQTRAINPQVRHLVGAPGDTWEHFSTTAWIYPPGTGLSMHDDGAGVYAGAYVYFASPLWRPHWGGLLMVLDDEGNRAIAEHKRTIDALAFHQKKWLHISGHDELAMECGL